jgi:hypothetical protein
MITENLQNHKYVLKLNKLYHLIFGEKFYKKLEFDWSVHPERYEIIQETILRKKYKNYLEIGCDKNHLFTKINVEKKNKVKEALIEAAKNAQKVYDENKNKKTYYTGQIGINEKNLIGKAEEAIRSANSSKGGGTFISLTDKEFKKIVSKYYPKYYD